MLYTLINFEYTKNMALVSILLTFLVTILAISLMQKYLPHDLGREFALNGQLSKGKPRGAGIIFIICFVIMSLLFVPVNREYIIYCILLLAAMLSGFLDDKSDKPWSELKKGLIDMAISVMTAITFVNFQPDKVGFTFFHEFIEINPIIYIILAAILIFVSINVTNCSDGVDGLCGTLVAVTLVTIYFILPDNNYSLITLLLVASILGYLWFNTSPSRLLMGDAGSRALGFFIGMLVLKTFNPLIYIPVAFVLIIDGGLGLVKLTLLRLFKIHILKNVLTPIHDYARKTLKWSDSQVVFRFVLIQIFISLIVVYSRI